MTGPDDRRADAAPAQRWTSPPTLTGERVRLEPLTSAHVDGLLAAADDPATIFRWTSRPIETTDDARAFVAAADEDPDRVAFATIDTATGRLVGSTSFYEIAPRYRSLAIGHTWLGVAAQRTGINTEAKILQLTHAFEVLGALRVVWHTDEHNARSRAAIARLGATFEGLLRKHRQRRDGSWRTTAQFAMVDDDWPDAREALRATLHAPTHRDDP